MNLFHNQLLLFQYTSLSCLLINLYIFKVKLNIFNYKTYLKVNNNVTKLNKCTLIKRLIHIHFLIAHHNYMHQSYQMSVDELSKQMFLNVKYLSKQSN